MSSIKTTAKHGKDLDGISFGFTGSAGFIYGISAEKSWSLLDPNETDDQLGTGLGGGLYLGAGFTGTYAW